MSAELEHSDFTERDGTVRAAGVGTGMHCRAWQDRCGTGHSAPWNIALYQ
ncbi:hypothetical protein OG239_42260 (plasmid) [Streptomyces sp. NBC_00868]|nr:hypothetical protein OG239_42260 [Streptomyces sp. NBC_00868]